MRKLRLGENEKLVLEAVGLGALVIASLIAPNLPVCLKPFLNQKRGKEKLKRTYKRLEEKGLIFLSGEKIKLSPSGQKILEQMRIDDIEIKSEQWDGVWHIVGYDVPNKFNKQRSYFRKKLIDLGFVKVQKSFWAIPYPCQEEIAIIAQTIGLSPYVLYLNADHLPNQDKYLEHFGLKKSS